MENIYENYIYYYDVIIKNTSNSPVQPASIFENPITNTIIGGLIVLISTGVIEFIKHRVQTKNFKDQVFERDKVNTLGIGIKLKYIIDSLRMIKLNINEILQDDEFKANPAIGIQGMIGYHKKEVYFEYRDISFISKDETAINYILRTEHYWNKILESLLYYESSRDEFIKSDLMERAINPENADANKLAHERLNSLNKNILGIKDNIDEAITFVETGWEDLRKALSSHFKGQPYPFVDVMGKKKQ